MTFFPQGAIRTAIYDTLNATTAVTDLAAVYVGQAAPETETGDLVLVEVPSSVSRGDIKTDDGHELTQRIRVSTTHGKADVNVARAEGIAEAVHTAMLTIDPAGHHLLDVPEPSIEPQQYGLDDDARTAYDLLMDYDILTQTTA